jgi:hypothetical protein
MSTSPVELGTFKFSTCNDGVMSLSEYPYRCGFVVDTELRPSLTIGIDLPLASVELDSAPELEPVLVVVLAVLFGSVLGTVLAVEEVATIVSD